MPPTIRYEPNFFLSAIGQGLAGRGAAQAQGQLAEAQSKSRSLKDFQETLRYLTERQDRLSRDRQEQQDREAGRAQRLNISTLNKYGAPYEEIERAAAMGGQSVSEYLQQLEIEQAGARFESHMTELGFERGMSRAQQTRLAQLAGEFGDLGESTTGDPEEIQDEMNRILGEMERIKSSGSWVLPEENRPPTVQEMIDSGSIAEFAGKLIVHDPFQGRIVIHNLGDDKLEYMRLKDEAAREKEMGRRLNDRIEEFQLENDRWPNEQEENKIAQEIIEEFARIDRMMSRFKGVDPSAEEQRQREAKRGVGLPKDRPKVRNIQREQRVAAAVGIIGELTQMLGDDPLSWPPDMIYQAISAIEEVKLVAQEEVRDQGGMTPETRQILRQLNDFEKKLSGR